ncbi:MAG: Frizzy aggregation protein FrzB [Myxococcaceae bacterium]|nr:Frizzy aggregation protein FrzB [Myxococcaceae bacterium]MCI0671330.1 Frizzy aggregation protein FrzB [Myxococcaceae bacterium]
MSARTVQDAPETVDILLVEVGEEVYGVDASQVLRIDRAGPQSFALAALGALRHGRRTLVYWTDSGEAQLKVDAVRGVSAVPLACLRRMPPAATRSPLAIGLSLAEERPVVLIDLPRTF